MRYTLSVRRAAVAGLTFIGLVAAMFVSGVASRAEVPTPAANEAVVTVSVGDLRTGATTVGPLVGAQYGLFASRPPDTAVSSDGYVTATPAYTCTSDADGDCSFVVQIGAGGIAQGTRLWLGAISGPAGYYTTGTVQTGYNAADTATNRVLWPTPALVAGQTYRSGATWVTDPGLAAITGSPEAGQAAYTRRTSSGGLVALSRANPPLVPQCAGLNVALVADLSASMEADGVEALKDAMDAVIDALQGTPSQVAIFTLGTDSPAISSAGAVYPPNTGLQSVATVADASKVKDYYSGWTDNLINWTNWDRGLAAVSEINGAVGAGDHIDLVVLITDGNPTVYGPSPTVTGGTGYTRFRELDAARASANLLKSQDSRILAVGVGRGVSSDGAGYNLQTISGLTKYDGSNITTADYIQTEDFSTVGTALHDLMTSDCSASISVVKRVIPNGGAIADAYTPSDPWQFAAQSLVAPATIDPGPLSTDAMTGGVVFDVDFQGASTGTFEITESPQPGYNLYQVAADGTDAPAAQNAFCVDKATGPIPVTNVGTSGFSVEPSAGSSVNCVVYNEEPSNIAAVVAHKRWQVVVGSTTTDYLNGAQPPGLRAQLSMTGPSPAAASAQPWSQERTGYDRTGADTTVTLSEAVTLAPPECTLTDVTVEAGAPADTTPGSGTPVSVGSPSTNRPVGPGSNEWTFTNVVECKSYLTLSKQVAFPVSLSANTVGEATTDQWTLNAIAPTGALPGPQGRDGSAGVTRVEVTPEVSYQLAETPDATPEFLTHYAQFDVRTQPLAYPQSTGSWSCQVAGTGRQVRMILGNEGGIAVPIGEHMQCTALNSVALVNIQKTVQGGTAQPSDFTFTVVPVAPVLAGGHEHEVPGTAGPDGYTITVRPDQHYKIVETGPPGYTIVESASVCLTSLNILNRNDFALPAGAKAACLVVNRAMSQLSVLKLDATTGEPLAEAVFDLAKDNGNGVYDTGADGVVASCTTGTSGTCTVGDLDFGTYFWVERTAPAGYESPAGAVSGPIVVDASNAGSTFAVTTVRDAEILTTISVLKVDQASSDPLPGAVFQLYRSASGNEPGNTPSAADEAVGPQCTTGADGLCTATDLVFGDYYWHEVSPAPGYPVPADQTSALVNLNAANAGTTVPVYQFTNPRVPGAAQVLKVDEEDTSVVLTGGTFELYLDDGDGAYGPSDTLVGGCTTNATGTCMLKDLDAGTYFWVEMSAPIGYDLPADPVSAPFQITAENVDDVQTVTFADLKTPSPFEPEDPDNPDGPDTPVQPGQPGDPGNPGNPNTPAKPGRPGGLPYTGGVFAPIVGFAALMVAAGGLLVTVRRRRSRGTV